MDPSIIISTQIPPKSVAFFVMSSLLWNVAIASAFRYLTKENNNPGQSLHEHSVPYEIMQCFRIIFGATIIIHGTFILCGNHPFDHPMNTFLSASYIAINIIIPVNMNVNASPDKKNIRETIHFLLGPILPHELAKNSDKPNVYSLQQRQRFRIQQLYQWLFLGECVGMGACTILRILDHGMQIQRCPMPILIGAVVGECCGVLLGFVMGIFM